MNQIDPKKSPFRSQAFGYGAFTIGAEAADVRNVAVRLKNSRRQNVSGRMSLLCYLSTDAEGDNVAATAPSGGVVVGTKGLAIPLVADKALLVTTDVNGEFDLNITETGAATFYLILCMPDGSTQASAAIAFV